MIDAFQYVYRLEFIAKDGGLATLIVTGETLEHALSRGCGHIFETTGHRAVLLSVSRCFNTREEQDDALRVLDVVRRSA